jgi:hypothetical protein
MKKEEARPLILWGCIGLAMVSGSLLWWYWPRTPRQDTAADLAVQAPPSVTTPALASTATTLPSASPSAEADAASPEDTVRQAEGTWHSEEAKLEVTIDPAKPRDGKRPPFHLRALSWDGPQATYDCDFTDADKVIPFDQSFPRLYRSWCGGTDTRGKRTAIGLQLSDDGLVFALSVNGAWRIKPTKLTRKS